MTRILSSASCSRPSRVRTAVEAYRWPPCVDGIDAEELEHATPAGGRIDKLGVTGSTPVPPIRWKPAQAGLSSSQGRTRVALRVHEMRTAVLKSRPR